MRKVLETAVLYSLEFDLLTQPFDNVKEMSLQEFQLIADTMRIKTGKRLGFKFQADNDGLHKPESFLRKKNG